MKQHVKSYLHSECLNDQEFQMRWAYLYEAGCWVSPLFKVLLSVLLLDLQSKARAKNTLHPQKEHKRPLLLRFNLMIWTKRDCMCAAHICEQRITEQLMRVSQTGRWGALQSHILCVLKHIIKIITVQTVCLGSQKCY